MSEIHGRTARHGASAAGGVLVTGPDRCYNPDDGPITTSIQVRDVMATFPRAEQKPMVVPEPSEVWAWLRARWRDLVAVAVHPEARVVWGLVLLAAVLRLSSLDLIEFKADEANHLWRGLEIVEHGRLPLVGSPSSYGPAKPPMMTYLMAIPLVFGRDPRYAAAFVALLNVAAVAGTYVIACRYYGRRAALFAGLLFAVNPWAVVLSRKAFTADVLAPMGVVLFGGLLAAVVDRRAWGWTLSIVALATMLLTTFSPAPLALVMVLVVVAYRRRVHWRYLLLGVLLAMVLAAPYLYYLGMTRLGDVREAARQVLDGDGGAMRSAGLLPLDLATRLHSGGAIEALGGQASATLASSLGPMNYSVRALAVVFLASLPLLLVLALRAWARWRERIDAALYVIPALWLWIPLLALAVWREPIAQHYLVILWPVGFVAMGMAFDRLLTALEVPSRRTWPFAVSVFGAVWVLVIVLVLAQAYGVTKLYRFIAAHDASDAYGVPLRTWLRTVGLVQREMGATDADQVWVIGNGVDPAFENEPAVLQYLLGPDVRVAFLGQGGHEALLLPVERPGLYLVTRPAQHAMQLLTNLGGEVRGLVALPDGRPAMQVVAVPQYSAAEVLDDIPNRCLWKLDTGLHLLGYEWPLSARPGERVTLATYWALLDVPEETRAHQHSLFNHLMAGDQRVAQIDGFGLPERSWQDGLVLLQWFAIDLPADLEAGEYTLLTGMYALDDMTRSRILDGGEGDTITLGPVRVDG